MTKIVEDKSAVTATVELTEGISKLSVSAKDKVPEEETAAAKNKKNESVNDGIKVDSMENDKTTPKKVSSSNAKTSKTVESSDEGEAVNGLTHSARRRRRMQAADFISSSEDENEESSNSKGLAKKPNPHQPKNKQKGADEDSSKNSASSRVPINPESIPQNNGNYFLHDDRYQDNASGPRSKGSNPKNGRVRSANNGSSNLGSENNSPVNGRNPRGANNNNRRGGGPRNRDYNTLENGDKWTHDKFENQTDGKESNRRRRGGNRKLNGKDGLDLISAQSEQALSHEISKDTSGIGKSEVAPNNSWNHASSFEPRPEVKSSKPWQQQGSDSIQESGGGWGKINNSNTGGNWGDDANPTNDVSPVKPAKTLPTKDNATIEKEKGIKGKREKKRETGKESTIGKESTTSAIGKESTTSAIGKESTTSTIGKESTTSAIGKESTTSAIGKESTTSTIGKENTTGKVSKPTNDTNENATSTTNATPTSTANSNKNRRRGKPITISKYVQCNLIGGKLADIGKAGDRGRSRESIASAGSKPILSESPSRELHAEFHKSQERLNLDPSDPGNNDSNNNIHRKSLSEDKNVWRKNERNPEKSLNNFYENQQQNPNSNSYSNSYSNSNANHHHHNHYNNNRRSNYRGGYNHRSNGRGGYPSYQSDNQQSYNSNQQNYHRNYNNSNGTSQQMEYIDPMVPYTYAYVPVGGPGDNVVGNFGNSPSGTAGWQMVAIPSPYYAQENPNPNNPNVPGYYDHHHNLPSNSYGQVNYYNNNNYNNNGGAGKRYKSGGAAYAFNNHAFKDNNNNTNNRYNSSNNSTSVNLQSSNADVKDDTQSQPNPNPKPQSQPQPQQEQEQVQGQEQGQSKNNE